MSYVRFKRYATRQDIVYLSYIGMYNVKSCNPFQCVYAVMPCYSIMRCIKLDSLVDCTA